MARPNLLAVDDDVSVLEAVVQDLRRQYGADYRVMRAASGQAALDTLGQLKAREEPVALLLSDQRMPGMPGVEFLERARQGRYDPWAFRETPEEITIFDSTGMALQDVAAAAVVFESARQHRFGVSMSFAA